jgi:hypothetical protein
MVEKAEAGEAGTELKLSGGDRPLAALLLESALLKPYRPWKVYEGLVQGRGLRAFREGGVDDPAIQIEEDHVAAS